ncbi:polysaccharide biosynthesis tyrosine autokinase [Robertkochia marina]|uniref:non-specific protein-tyrosine kinase n=1 Tax=Robertkochia marina TaxID=1227945 RepID=A0A4S3LYT5_9FLAO|nr:tyrosine-protein kinase family protein [Robertkochia marina]THD66788.1 polysaccharide biosynthesis tyrosine autokinase [Robertkochia marina]TRZ41921.1 polysaccharide biosynthesis tyrosine autokinase [Robertkochia marina]
MEDLTSSNKNQLIDFTQLKKLLIRLLKNWYWFAISVTLAIALTYLYSRTLTSQFASSTSILLGEEVSNSPEQAFFKEFNITNGNQKIEDEIAILKSRSIMMDVVKTLNLNFQYFVQGRVNALELYKEDVPILVNFMVADSVVERSNLTYYFQFVSTTEFKYSTDGNFFNKSGAFGKQFETPIGNMIITPKIDDIMDYSGVNFVFRLSNVRSVAESYRNRLNIAPNRDGSSILIISLSDPVNDKATDILNTIVKVYNGIAISEKEQLAAATSNFIDERIELISSELSDVDNSAERFKTGNKITDIDTEADKYVAADSEVERELNETGTELSMAQYISDYLSKQKKYELMPSNLGLSDKNLEGAISQYNKLLQTRNRLLNSSSEENPVIANIDQQLEGLRISMKRNIANYENTLNIRMNKLREQENRINSKIYSVPGKEKRFRNISRQQQIKESLYLYLLEKKEESNIALANTQPNAKVIDPAFSNYAAIGPNKRMYYLGGLLFGLMIPFLVIYIQDLLDNKIHSKEELQELLPSVPLLGELPRLKKKKQQRIKENDRSPFAESFRLLRTNLDYFIKGRKDSRKIIQVTSTIAGEGKSMVVYNLARTIVNSGSSVLIIGADIRNPGIDRFTRSLKGAKGLSDYLYDDNCRVDEVVQMTPELEHLWVVKGGKVPPNPAELLMNGRMKELIEKVEEHFDYILIDTAPSMLVTDTLVISELVDHTIYVVRANYLDKKALNHVKDVYKNEKIPGLMLLLNDVESSNLGYGTRYGYGYYGQKKKKGLLSYI